jgi:hypothetical protein
MVAVCMRYIADFGETDLARRRELKKLARLCALAGVDLKAA